VPEREGDLSIECLEIPVADAEAFTVVKNVPTLVRGDPGLMAENRAIGPSHGNDQGGAPGVSFRPRLEGPIPECRRNILGIENRSILWLGHQSVHEPTSPSSTEMLG
jgi:hypothetical protein